MHGERPLACDLSALDLSERERRQALASRLAAVTAETQELAGGYAFRYAAEMLPVVTEFTGLERRCCPFFRFAIEIEPDGGPLWLRIGGRPGVKAFIMAELGELRAGAIEDTQGMQAW